MFRGNRFYPVWGKIDYPHIDKKSDLGEVILRGLFCCHRVKNLEITGFFVHKTLIL